METLTLVANFLDRILNNVRKYFFCKKMELALKAQSPLIADSIDSIRVVEYSENSEFGKMVLDYEAKIEEYRLKNNLYMIHMVLKEIEETPVEKFLTLLDKPNENGIPTQSDKFNDIIELSDCVVYGRDAVGEKIWHEQVIELLGLRETLDEISRQRRESYR